MRTKIVTVGAATLLAIGGTVWATSGAGAADPGQENFTIVETHDGATLIAHGVFTDGGKDIQKNQKDRARLAKGAFDINHPDDQGTFSFKTNPNTCYYSLSGSGSYTLGNGTQAYKHLTGSGTYKVTGQGIASRKANGKCDFNSDNDTSVFIIHAHGPASLSGDSDS